MTQEQRPSIEGAILILVHTFYPWPWLSEPGYPTEHSARRLHPTDWRKYYDPEKATVWEDLLADASRGALLMDAVNQAMSRLIPKDKRVLELRYGLLDGQLRSVKEVMNYEEFRVTRNMIYARESRAFRELRHLPRSVRLLESFLPEELASY